MPKKLFIINIYKEIIKNLSNIYKSILLTWKNYNMDKITSKLSLILSQFLNVDMLPLFISG